MWQPFFRSVALGKVFLIFSSPSNLAITTDMHTCTLIYIYIYTKTHTKVKLDFTCLEGRKPICFDEPTSPFSFVIQVSQIWEWIGILLSFLFTWLNIPTVQEITNLQPCYFPFSIWRVCVCLWMWVFVLPTKKGREIQGDVQQYYSAWWSHFLFLLVQNQGFVYVIITIGFCRVISVNVSGILFGSWERYTSSISTSMQHPFLSEFHIPFHAWASYWTDNIFSSSKPSCYFTYTFNCLLIEVDGFCAFCNVYL